MTLVERDRENRKEGRKEVAINLLDILDDEIIGALFLIPEGEKTMCFEDFVIHPIFQGKGYGYKVLCMIEDLYPEIREWKLSTPIFSVGNQYLYEKFGYKEVSRDENEIYYKKLVYEQI